MSLDVVSTRISPTSSQELSLAREMPPGLSSSTALSDRGNPLQADPKVSGTPSSEDEDEHTLTAFGDISLSDIYFVPSLPSDVSPRRDDSFRIKVKGKRPTPKKARVLRNQYLLPVTPKRRQQPPSVMAHPQDDFKTMVESLRASHESSKSQSATTTSLADKHRSDPTTAIVVESPQPRRIIDVEKVVSDVIRGHSLAEMEKSSHNLSSPTKSTVPPVSPLSPPSKTVAAPVAVSKPLRGSAKLPRRPPLPRWDLLNADILT